MLILGITGSIGSGKSLASRYFAEAGCVVSDADQLARELTASDGGAMAAIREQFGSALIAPDGALDRDAMRTLAFRDPAAKALLEAILHPLIIASRAALRDELELSERRSGMEITFVSEAVLSIEAGLAGEYDHLIVVTAPDELRRARVSARDPHGAENFTRIDGAQMAQAEKLRRADWEIVNDGSPGRLRERSFAALAELRRRGSVLRQSPAAALLALLPPPAPGTAHELTWSKVFTSAPESGLRVALKPGDGVLRECSGAAADGAVLLNDLLRPFAAVTPTGDLAAPPPHWEFLPHEVPRATAHLRGSASATG